ncbi:MAG: tRNA (cytidine(34)-2'-O)-methyltransferase [Hansschlegelia sp.]
MSHRDRASRPFSTFWGIAIRLALYQPDIPQNAGTLLRLAACLGLAVDIVEPAGFPVSDRAFRRAGLDYLDRVEIERHVSFATFEQARRGAGRRLVLLTTRAETSFLDVSYGADDILMVGRESAGAPPAVHDAADLRVAIPMRAGLRSINVAVAAAMVISEALRQTAAFPSWGAKA